MSWSLSAKAPKAEARAAFEKAHQENAAYKNDGGHKAVMDACASFAGDLADAAPDGSEVSLASSGHVGDSNHGSVSVQVQF